MRKQTVNTRYMVTLAALCGVLLVLQVTGIGLIPLPAFKLTIMHIPVILGAILMGWRAGAVLGAVFGICSIWANTTQPNPVTSMFFSPFLSPGGFWGAVKAVWVSLVCRILIGLFAAWIWKLLKKLRCKEIVALPLTGVLSSLLHSAIVLGSICLLFPAEYAANSETAVDTLFTLVITTVFTNGLIEAAVAGVLVLLIGKALLRYLGDKQRRA